MTAVIVMFVVCGAIILMLLVGWLCAEREVRELRKQLHRLKEGRR